MSMNSEVKFYLTLKTFTRLNLLNLTAPTINSTVVGEKCQQIVHIIKHKHLLSIYSARGTKKQKLQALWEPKTC